MISQIGVGYRDSSLSEHTSDEPDDVKAGDRLPYFTVAGKSIFDKLQEPKFHLLVFSNSDHDQWENEFGDLVDYHIIPLDSRVSEIF